MAEIVGLVAGAAGLTTALKDLYKGIEILCEARRQFHDAPRTLSDLTGELQFLAHIVENLQPQEDAIRKNLRNGDAILDRSISTCQQVNAMLDNLRTKHLEVAASKGGARMKSLWSFRGWDKDVNALLNRIVNVKLDLSLIGDLGNRETVQQLLVITQQHEHRPLTLEPGIQEISTQITDSSPAVATNLSSSDSFTIETFSARYVRKRRRDCSKRKCPCSCHRQNRSYGNFWTFHFTPFEVFRQPCDFKMCTGTEYGIKIRVDMTPLGLLWAADVQLRVFTGSGGMSVQPPLAVRRVVPRNSHVLEIILDAMCEHRGERKRERIKRGSTEDSGWEIAKGKLLQLSRDDPTFVYHVYPDGQSYVQCLLFAYFSLAARTTSKDRRMADFFRFMLVDLGLLSHANLPQVLYMLLHFYSTSLGHELLCTLLEAGMDPFEAEGSTIGRGSAFGQVDKPAWLDEHLKPLCRQAPGFGEMTPLHESILFEQSDTLVSHWIFRSGLNEKNFWGQTPLHLAIQNPNQIALLIKAGHDVNTVDNSGYNPLEYTIWRTRSGFSESLQETIDVLVAAGTFIDLKKRSNLAALAGADVAACLVHALQKRGAHQTAQAVCNVVLPGLMVTHAIRLLEPAGVSEGGSQENTLLDYLVKVRPSLFIESQRKDLPDRSLLEFVTSVEQLRILLKHFDLSSHANHLQQGALTLLRPHDPISASTFQLTTLSDMMGAVLDSGVDVNQPDCWIHGPLHHNLITIHNHSLIFLWPTGLLERLRSVAQVLEATKLLLRRGADVSLTDQCKCSCSPYGCFPLAATCITSISSRKGDKYFTILPMSTILYLQMLLDYRGPSEARRALLLTIRKAKHEELGMTHVCCLQSGLGLFVSKRRVMSSEDTDDVLGEESDFIRLLDEEMGEIECASWDELVACWFSQIKSCLWKRCAESISHKEPLEDKPLFPNHEINLITESPIARGHFLKWSNHAMSRGIAVRIIFLEYLRFLAPSSPSSSNNESDCGRWYVRGYNQLLQLVKFLEFSEATIFDELKTQVEELRLETGELERGFDARGVPDRFMSEMKLLEAKEI